jgi:D-glycero-alpha-D-manno-heptose-7-phosphate kinase
MIISKTPYRISFFGGGSDYPAWYIKNGGKVLSTTINKYVYISCRHLPPFFNHKYRIVWSKLETVKKISQINHKAIREILNYYKIKNGLEIHYDGDLPARSGMGSSSVFVVGLLNILTNLLEKKLSKKKLAKKSIFFEQNILKEHVGSQDQIAVTYGGFNKILFKKKGDFEVNPIILPKTIIKNLNSNLLLVYTGISRTAHDIAKGYINKLEKSKSSHILNILNFVNEGERLLKAGSIDDFGKLLDESWKEKKALSSHISNSSIDSIYSLATKHGALGGKLLGAGGGGFFLFYVPKEKQNIFKKYLSKTIIIPFNFTNEGSEIMFNKNNDKIT